MARFTIRGNVSVRYYASAPADLAAISIIGDGTGTDYNGVAEAEALMGMDGWSTSASTIAVPDVLSLFTGQIPGEVTPGTGTLTYYTDSASNAIWDAEVEGSTGHIAIFPSPAAPGGAPASGDVYTIFSVEVIDRARSLTAGNEAETHTITYAILSRTEGTAAA